MTEEQFPPDVAFEWAVEDLIAAARLDPSILDQEIVKQTADRIMDAVGARQERLER
jgi:hypothetical protein